MRKKITKIYNKRETDFTSLHDYNDYLEEIEVIVFSLANKVNEEETKRKVGGCEGSLFGPTVLVSSFSIYTSI